VGLCPFWVQIPASASLLKLKSFIKDKKL